MDNKNEESLTRTGDNGYQDGENRYKFRAELSKRTFPPQKFATALVVVTTKLQSVLFTIHYEAH